MIDVIGQNAPQDAVYDRQSGTFWKPVEYRNALTGGYIYFMSSIGKVKHAIFFVSFNGMYDALNAALSWVVLFGEEEGATRIPTEQSIIYLYKKHFVTIECDGAEAKIIVTP
jgi:hypothetical protein